jgi:acetyltransferase-like isoleucine patch superfamily enzyme
MAIISYQDALTFLNAKRIFFSDRGKRRLANADFIRFNDDCIIESYVSFLEGVRLCRMGAFSYTWSQLPMDCEVGRYCSIAKGLTVLGKRHPIEWASTSSFAYDNRFTMFKVLKKDLGEDYEATPLEKAHGNVIIGNDVWIAANVVLKAGVKIGDGAVIAANSQVVKDVEPFSIVGGNPARVIRRRFDDAICDALLASRWWDYNFTGFKGLDLTSPIEFVEGVVQRAAQGGLSKINPPQKTLLQEYEDFKNTGNDAVDLA